MKGGKMTNLETKAQPKTSEANISFTGVAKIQEDNEIFYSSVSVNVDDIKVKPVIVLRGEADGKPFMGYVSYQSSLITNTPEYAEWSGAQSITFPEDVAYALLCAQVNAINEWVDKIDNFINYRPHSFRIEFDKSQNKVYLVSIEDEYMPKSPGLVCDTNNKYFRKVNKALEQTHITYEEFRDFIARHGHSISTDGDRLSGIADSKTIIRELNLIIE